MKYKTIVTGLTILIILLVSVGIATAQEPEPNGNINLQASVSTAFTYQGRLTDASGNPIDGSVNLVFQLWDDATAGSQVGSDITKNNLSVKDGLFTVKLDVPQDAFNGQALWLRIQVNGQWLSPRQELLPVPYALGLKPGAVINSSIYNTPVLQVENTDSSAGGGSAIAAINASNNTWRPAIYGENTGASAGVYGRSDGWHATVGYQASSDSSFAGVWGHNAGAGHGVYGDAQGYGSRGVYGKSSDNEWGFGIYGEALGTHSVGVLGVGATGVLAQTNDEGGTALWAVADAGYGTGIYAEGGHSSGYAADFKGNVQIRSRSTGATVIELGEGLDYAEGFDVSDESEISPGTVLVIDSTSPGELTVSDKPYDRKVAGIVAGAKELGSAVRLGPGQFDYDVALAGRVYCNVDAIYGSIEPGDLLTTSPTSGYAMKVSDYTKAQGAILGKAMEKLEQGKKGQILVLVTLQ